MHVSDEYSELGQELKNGLVIDPPRFCKKLQNLAPMRDIGRGGVQFSGILRYVTFERPLI